jgi:two-component system response regulator YesN
MDGLTLSRRIKKSYPDVTVIILTAHDHFKYAQQALNSGVDSYVLKPADKTVLEQAVSETAGRIREKRALLSRMEISYKYVQNHQPFFRGRLLSELTRKGSAEGINEILEAAGVSFGAESLFTLALMSITGDGSADFTARKYFLLNNCRDYIDENYNTHGQLFTFEDGTDNLAVLSHLKDTDLPLICRRVTEAVGGSLGCGLRYGVSDPFKEASDLPKARAQAEEALQLAIISDSDVSQGQINLEEQVSALLLFIKSGLSSKAVPLAGSLIYHSGESHGGDLNAAKMFAVGFLSRTTDMLSNMGIPWLTLAALVTPWYAHIFEKGTFAEVVSLFTGQVSVLCETAEEYQRKKTGETVAKILNDIEENYGDADLTLSSLAHRHSLNSSYLSRAFKNYTGKPFSEYLVETRIRKAYEIMERGDLKAYQIAQMTGIPDPNYFAKCFKKVAGVSFQAYKSGKKEGRRGQGSGGGNTP